MKFNYKRDAVLGFVGMAIMLASSIYSFASDMQSKGILLMCLAGVMLIFGIFCVVKMNTKKSKDDEK